MKLLPVFLLVVLLTVTATDARQRMKGGKVTHKRSKRTIGDIINWKLNLINSLFGGIKGIFGGNDGNNQRPSYQAQKPRPVYNGKRLKPKPSYKQNMPRPRPRPSRPNYGNQRPRKPSYVGSKPRPANKPKPQYPSSNDVARPQQQYGPSSAIRMLPSPNLATEGPQAASNAVGSVSSYQPGPGSSRAPSALDTVRSPQPTFSAQAVDTYGSPQANPVSIKQPSSSVSQQFSPPQTNQDSYVAPVSSPFSQPSSVSSTGNVNTYSAAPNSNFGTSSSVQQSSSVEADSYGVPLGNPVISSSSNSQNSFAVSDTSSVSLSDTSEDSYGTPLGNPVSSSSNSFSSSVNSPSVSNTLSSQSSYSSIENSQAVSTSQSASSFQSLPVSIGDFVSNPSISNSESSQDSYGTPIGTPISSPSIPIYSGDETPAGSELAQDSYGASLAPVITDTYDEYDPSDIPADQAAPASDSYGAAIAPVLEISSDYDEYDPNDIPADQAAPQPSYGSEPLDTYAAEPLDTYSYNRNPKLLSFGESEPIINDNSVFVDMSESPREEITASLSPEKTFDNEVTTSAIQNIQLDENQKTSDERIKKEKLFDSGEVIESGSNLTDDDLETSDIINVYDNSLTSTSFEEFDDYVVSDDSASAPVDVFGSQLAPVGTSAPVPDDVFTSDEADSFNPVNQDITINLTEEEFRTNDGVPITNDIEYPVEIENSKPSDILKTDDDKLLPPIDYDELSLVEDTDFATPTTGPIFFTHPPTEGPEIDEEDFQPTIIIVQSNEDGSSESDPLNVIPDEYESEDYNAIEAEDTLFVDELPVSTTAPTPPFGDLRDIVEFTTGRALPSIDVDPLPTTFRPDFNLGSNSIVEVVNLLSNKQIPETRKTQTLQKTIDNNDTDSIGTEDISEEKSFTKGVRDLITQVPFTVFFGNPTKEPTTSTSTTATSSTTEISFESRNSEKEKFVKKRKTSDRKKGWRGHWGRGTLKQRYNNWFGASNDWSHRIQEVKGRFRFKNGEQ